MENLSSVAECAEEIADSFERKRVLLGERAQEVYSEAILSLITELEVAEWPSLFKSEDYLFCIADQLLSEAETHSVRSPALLMLVISIPPTLSEFNRTQTINFPITGARHRSASDASSKHSEQSASLSADQDVASALLKCSIQSDS